MPNPRAFLQGFGLHKNALIPNVVVTKVKIGHDVIEQYKIYEFPLVINVTSTVTQEETLEAVRTYLSGHKVINSQYGNPYDCWISGFTISDGTDKVFTLTAMGHGKRIYKSKA